MHLLSLSDMFLWMPEVWGRGDPEVGKERSVKAEGMLSLTGSRRVTRGTLCSTGKGLIFLPHSSVALCPASKPLQVCDPYRVTMPGPCLPGCPLSWGPSLLPPA